MAAKHYLALIAGKIQEVVATVTSAGAADDGKIVALDSSGRLDSSVMPVGVGADTKTATASESLSAGDLVNFWNDTGTLKVRKADATATGKEADGFVLGAVSSGASATVYKAGTNTGVTGLTAATVYYLSTTAGSVTSTAPSGSGNVVQEVGKATAAGELIFRPGPAVVLA